ncbi:hypothetical protein GTY86_19435 [Streptomyces sp. SID5770]|nr:hypothetical protein [Streptomyces sp. SID5770]
MLPRGRRDDLRTGTAPHARPVRRVPRRYTAAAPAGARVDPADEASRRALDAAGAGLPYPRVRAVFQVAPGGADPDARVRIGGEAAAFFRRHLP